MQQVIIWSVVCGVLVFSTGLASAIVSRKQRKSKSHTVIVVQSANEAPNKNQIRVSGISMAGSGTSNASVKEGELASVGGDSR